MKCAYIRHAQKEERIESLKPKMFSHIIRWYQKKRGIIETKKIENGYVHLLPYQKEEEITEKQLKKIARHLNSLLYKEIVSTVVLSNSLFEKQVLKNELYGNNIHILEGSSLYFAMVPEIIEYISYWQQREMEKQDITILVNEYTQNTLLQLIHLAQKVRNLKIVTNHMNTFKTLENHLYDTMGIVITLSNNKRKSLSREEMIINFDFPEELIKTYRINRTAIIINVGNKIESLPNSFDGIMINGIQITLPDDLKEKLQKDDILQDFNETVLYESWMDRKRLEMLQSQIKKDKIAIAGLVGNNGIISKDEYKRVNQRKVAG